VRPMKSWLSCGIAVLVLMAICATYAPKGVAGGLHWPARKKGQMRVRLVALAWNHPRSSFFANEEIFVAEKELSPGELSLVKLVYGFLPYQPRLSEAGFDYSVVHEVRAVRDPSCDETLFQLTTDEQYGTPINLKYSQDSPVSDLERRHSPLPCYTTSADDYAKALYQPVNAPPGRERAHATGNGGQSLFSSPVVSPASPNMP
jgi:hypothetical protein